MNTRRNEPLFQKPCNSDICMRRAREVKRPYCYSYRVRLTVSERTRCRHGTHEWLRIWYRKKGSDSLNHPRRLGNEQVICLCFALRRQDFKKKKKRAAADERGGRAENMRGKTERDGDGGADQSERVKESTETEWKDAALLCTGGQSERGKWKCIRLQMRLIKNDFSILPRSASNVWH